MLKKFLFLFYCLFSLFFLIYLVVPGPDSITDFPPLPTSLKSSLEGDTIQVPNVSAYFSDNFRNEAVKYYKDAYQKNTPFFFPPLRLNHPPEYAYTVIKDQTESTYIEEYTYPFRDSLYVNGMEPVNEDGTPRFTGASKYKIDDVEYSTKVTLRYYPSNIVSRLILWVGINFSIIILYVTGRRLFANGQT